MEIKNLMEDIVVSTLKEVLKKEEMDISSDTDIKDIIAYVLNRIPPRYITSERGIIHGKLEAKFEIQQRTDILFLIHEALDQIRNRRLSTALSNSEAVLSPEKVFPHVMGEVLEESTFSIIPDIEVTMLFNGQPAKMIDDSWKNPYKLSKATKGYYHFWPKYNASEMDGQSEVAFVIQLNHPKLISKEINLKIKPIENISLYESQVVPLSLLQIKEGEDIAFLYE